LFGWCILNIGCALAQYQHLGRVTVPMILVNIFQALYVWDAIYSEQAILTTMDITTDGFGFMLAFGDLAWVPFSYSLQARFLVEHSPEGLPDIFWVLVVAIKVIGFIIFRGANGEKDQFRRDPTHPSVSHIKTLETQRGKKLMITGWWGMARKINYTGDWLMGLAWCLTTGFQTPLTYFYSIYFLILLVHRALRDDEACTKKYGEEDWEKYKKAVPYIFVPRVI
jgi:delta14-sterol reductase